MKKVILLAVMSVVLMLAVNAFAVPRLETFIVGSTFITIDRQVSNPEVASTTDINTTATGYWQGTVGSGALSARGRGHGNGNGNGDDIHGHIHPKPGNDPKYRPKPQATPEPGTLSLLGLGLLGLTPLLRMRKK